MAEDVLPAAPPCAAQVLRVLGGLLWSQRPGDGGGSPRTGAGGSSVQEYGYAASSRGVGCWPSATCLAPRACVRARAYTYVHVHPGRDQAVSPGADTCLPLAEGGLHTSGGAVRGSGYKPWRTSIKPEYKHSIPAGLFCWSLCQCKEYFPIG